MLLTVLITFIPLPLASFLPPSLFSFYILQFVFAAVNVCIPRGQLKPVHTRLNRPAPSAGLVRSPRSVPPVHSFSLRLRLKLTTRGSPSALAPADSGS